MKISCRYHHRIQHIEVSNYLSEYYKFLSFESQNGKCTFNAQTHTRKVHRKCNLSVEAIFQF